MIFEIIKLYCLICEGVTMKPLLKCLRIAEWRGYLGLYLAGALCGGISSLVKPDTVLGICASFLPFMAATYIANNVGDAECDALNPRKASKNPLATGELSRRVALYTLALTATLGTLLTSVLLPQALLTYLAALALSLAYSLPPRLKCRPPLDVVSHALFFGALLLLMGATAAGVTPDVTSLALAASYSSFLELRNEMEDLEYDAIGRCATTAVGLGAHRSELLTRALGGLSVAIAAFKAQQLPWMLVLAPAALAAYLHSNCVGKGARAVDAYVAACFVLPALGVQACA